MQNRYLGDVHDFYKFVFLKYLSKKLKQKIGLNWYLVDPKELGVSELNKNDGENRKFLKNKISTVDIEIFEELLVFQDYKKRKIENFSERTHLKKYINFFNLKVSTSQRLDWFNKSVNFFSGEKIIFLDPDNGLAKRNLSNRESLKYVMIEEVKKYISLKKIVVFTQFQSFNKQHIDYVREIKSILIANHLNVQVPIIRNRTAPNTFFITVSNKNDSMNKVLECAIFEYLKFSSDKVELITV